MKIHNILKSVVKMDTYKQLNIWKCKFISRIKQQILKFHVTIYTTTIVIKVVCFLKCQNSVFIH